MMKRPNAKTLSAMVAGAALMFVSLPSAAQVGDLGQFLVGKMSGHDMWVANPTSREMYAMHIVYLRDGGLDLEYNETSLGADDGGCQGAVIPPHGTADNEFDDDGYDERQSFELISVPTDTGEYDRLGRSSLGVIARESKNRQGRAIKPSFFRLPTGSDRADLVSCICAELSDDGQSDDLFSALGVSCAPRGQERPSVKKLASRAG